MAMQPQYRKNSIALIGTVSMGTGVMIGASIFALTGQIAELAGVWFPMSFVAGAVVTVIDTGRSTNAHTQPLSPLPTVFAWTIAQ